MTVRHDWEAVRTTFVEGYMDPDGQLRWPNLRETSEFHSVPYNRCRERASREGWNEARAAFQAQLEHARQSERAQHAAREATDLDGKALTASKTGLMLVLNRLQKISKALLQQEQGAGEGQFGDSFLFPEDVDARELATLARAAAEWRALGAAALGMPDKVTSVEHSGPGGTPIDLRTELMFDDPNDSRLTGILVAMERAGLLDGPGDEEGPPGDDDPQDPVG